MKKTLERNKNKPYPKVSRSLEEIRDQFKDENIMKEYGYDYENKSVFYVGTEVTSDYGFIVFKSQYVIDFIKNNIRPSLRKYLMDGTFDSLPNEYYQLVVIAIEHQNEV